MHSIHYCGLAAFGIVLVSYMSSSLAFRPGLHLKKNLIVTDFFLTGFHQLLL